MSRRKKRPRAQRPGLSVDDRFLRGSRAAPWHGRFLPVAGLELLADFGLDCYLIEEDRRTWHQVHMVPVREPTRVDFETLYGKERARARYNRASFEEVASTRAPLHGTYHGFHDLFVPVLAKGEVCAFLASGPFLTERFERADIERQWRELTGNVARAGDPDFVVYVRTVLATPRFSAAELTAWTRSLVAYAALLTAEGDGTAQFEALRRARDELSSPPRYLVRTAAAELIDRRHNAQWRAEYNEQSRREAGLERVPNVVLAAAPRSSLRDIATRVDDLLRGRAVQEACLEFCQSMPNAVAGQLGDAGCYVLTSVDETLPRQRTKSALAAIARALCDAVKAAAGVELVVGVGPLSPGGEGLPNGYDAAVLALLAGVNEGKSLRFHEATREALGKRNDLPSLLAELAAELERGSRSALEIGLDRFVRHVVGRSRGNRDALRAYCEMAFVELSAIVTRAAVTDEKSLRALLSRIEAELDESNGLMMPTLVLQRAVLELRGLLEHPKVADREARVARAMQLVRSRLGEKVGIREIAHDVGFAPGYLSKLFREQAGEGLGAYRRRLRIERAKTLLRTTDIPIGRLVSEAGFTSRQSFFATFREIVGVSPGAYRAGRE